jgi:hypothetical protein
MSYENRALKAKCKKCSRQIAWFWKDQREAPTSWLCQCGCRNFLVKPPEWPNVPRTLYLGWDHNRRLRVHPFPPSKAESENPVWAQPYSIRSFLLQASNALGGCSYGCSTRGNVMDETILADRCYSPLDPAEWPEGPETWDCHLAGGWTNGQSTCPLWENIAKLCQSESEWRFLHRYLGYTKHRQFPMLLPQTSIGIGERRRPDFVAYIPTQYWNYKWIAIQLDGAHPETQKESDKERDAYIIEQGYDVLSIRSTKTGYFAEVRELVERFENDLNLAEDDPWASAIEGEVSRAVQERPDPNDIPF